MGVCIMENKITKKMRFEEIKAIAENMGREDLVKFAEHEIELIDKKASNRKTGTSKKVKENNEIAQIVLEELAKIGKTTITDLIRKSEIISDYITEDGKSLSNQRITAILKPLIRTEENPNGQIIRTTEKKTVYFEIAEEEEA